MFESENLTPDDFSFFNNNWIQAVIKSFVISEDQLGELADSDLDTIKRTAMQLCRILRSRFKIHVKTRIEDRNKHDHWCLAWFEINLPRTATAMVLVGHILPIDALECTGRATCLLKNAMATDCFVKVKKDSEYEGCYLLFHTISCTWPRSGKAVGRPMATRNEEHRRKALLKEAADVNSLFYRSFPDRMARLISNITRRGYFDELVQYCGLLHSLEVTLASLLFVKVMKEGSSFGPAVIFRLLGGLSLLELGQMTLKNGKFTWLDIFVSSLMTWL